MTSVGGAGQQDGVSDLVSRFSTLASADTACPTSSRRDSGSNGAEMQPRLPPEVLEYIISLLAVGAEAGDAGTQRALIRLSGVSRVVRHWSFRALYTVLVLPRHVRDFRKWYARNRSMSPPFPFAGYTRALFCALDDISRLTTFSAGWDSEMLRMLHYCGPTLSHLSLWRSESTALLRDPGQVRASHRLGKTQPAWTWGSGGVIEVNDVEASGRSGPNGHGPGDDDDNDDDDGPISAAASARQRREEEEDLPNWLRSELSSSSASDVLARHRAHLSSTPSSSVEVRGRTSGCRPRCVSLMLSLPLYEHEDPQLFAMMSVWSRVEELDIYIPTPAQAAKCLYLVASLHRSPIRRLRVGTCHATLVMLKPPFPRSRREQGAQLNNREDVTMVDFQPSPNDGSEGIPPPPFPTAEMRNDPQQQLAPPNLPLLLSRYLQHPGLYQALIDEFTGRQHTSHPALLERLLLDQYTTSVATRQSQLRICLTQRNQQGWAKLKDRMWDFSQRVHGLSDGAWELLS